MSCLEFAALIASALLAPLSIKHGEKSRDPEVCRVSMDYSEVSLEIIFRDLEKTTGIPIEIHPDLRADMDLGRQKVSLKLRDISMLSALNLMLRPRFPTLSIFPLDHRRVVIVSNH